MTHRSNSIGCHARRCLAAFLVLLMAGNSIARQPLPPINKADLSRTAIETRAASDRMVLHAAHSVGKMRLTIANNGQFGSSGVEIPDPVTGEMLPSCEYPINSGITLLWVGAFWIGAVVGRDTLVSCGEEDSYVTNEFWPETEELGGKLTYNSINPSSKYYDPTRPAYSEEDIVCEYRDTIVDPNLVGRDNTDGRGHKPLGLKITQRSMAWSYDYADDFVLFDFEIENIGYDRLEALYIGIWADGDAFHETLADYDHWTDDIAGFYFSHPAPEGCGFIDTVRIAYHTDNDGDPYPVVNPNRWDYRSILSAVGARIVRTPSDTLEFAYNWWITNYGNAEQDFGPRHRGTPQNPFRDIGAGLGTPDGDRNKYYVMRNQEFDYDLMKIATISATDSLWLPPPSYAKGYASGYDLRYLLSCGPFDLEPGQTLPLSFAWVGGENFHQNPTDWEEYWDPEHPDRYIDKLDFSDLALNARWASWVFDNPGVDTDDDGYRGKYRICYEGLVDSSLAETLWYEGDGVPDFRGAGPPPAPMMRLIPSDGKLTVRFNGYFSETTRDVFTQLVDFEGYRVYTALDDRPGSFSVVRSYDLEDYSRFVWVDRDEGSKWIRDEEPYTLEELRAIYDDSTFAPLRYTRAHPLSRDGQFFFFEKQDFNQSSLLDPDGIRKVYPDAPNPGTDTTAWQEEDLVFDYGTPLPKYYEYEFVVDNLLPTIPYYVSVTAFDYGSPKSGLGALETKPLNSAIREYPQHSVDYIQEHNLDVYVYPNPYRFDADYVERGYENRDGTTGQDRWHIVNFSNLPPVCKISIFSLDGDLIREIDHNMPGGGPESMHDYWDLITRNTQLVVSGLYYWVVESPERTQMGKLVILE